MDSSQPTSMHQKLARNVSLLSLSVGATMGIGLIIKTILPRIMGPEKMGIFIFADSYANLFFAFLPLGLTTYINRTIPSNHKHTREIFGTIITIETLVAVLIAFIMYGSLVWTGKDAETIWCTLAMGIYAAIFNFQRNILQKIFIAIDRVRLISMVNVVVKIILVLGCLLVFKIQPTVLLVAVMYGISELFGLIYLLFEAKKLRFFGSRPNLIQLKSILKISLPFYLASVLTTAFTEVDTIMLGSFSNNTEVGYFGAANKLIGVFLLMIPILQSSFTPALSQAWSAGKGQFEILVKQLLNFLLVCSLPLSVVLVLFGDYISRILYGEGFESSYKILCFLAPVLTMMYLNTFTAVSLHLSSTGGKISSIFVLGIVINVVLDYFLIPIGAKFGPGGVGVAVSFCTFICEVYTFLAMLRIFPSKVLDLKLFKNLIVILTPCWLGMLFYEPMIALNFWERLALAALVPFYAVLTRLVTISELRNFSLFLRDAIKKR